MSLGHEYGHYSALFFEMMMAIRMISVAITPRLLVSMMVGVRSYSR